MKQYKYAIYKFFTITIVIPFSLYILIFIYDPLQVFHKPWFRDLAFHSNMAEQAAGVIKNYKFDSILLGTSMLQNTSSFETSKKLGGKFVNLSISGSDFYERSFVLKYALKYKKIKTIIYSLDANAYFQERMGRDEYIQTFYKLYDDKFYTNFNIYLNTRYMKCLSTFSNSDNCIGSIKNLNFPGKWFNKKRDYSRFGGIENWFSINLKDKEINALKSIVNLEKGKKETTFHIKNNPIKYIDDNIISIVKRNKNTNFILFFPPYARLEYALWIQKDVNKFRLHKKIIKYLVTQSDKLNNLKIYAFGEEKFLDNLENYMDLHHYHKKINTFMLNSFASDFGLLTKSNVDKYIKVITEKSLKYDISVPAKYIETRLKKDNL